MKSLLQWLLCIYLFLINFVVCQMCPTYGDRCENCTSQSICVKCKVGFWNVNGNCANTCVTPTCTCTKYWECLSCKEGHYDVEKGCNKLCPSECNGRACNNDGTCLCKPNFTGNACDSCVDGMHGSNCSMQCSRGCEGNKCSQTDGSCTCKEYYSGEQCGNCITDRYGEDCKKPCSIGCLENTCSPTDGKCDCKDFYRGDKCDVCEDGRYGEIECDKKCSSGCESVSCNPNGTCFCKPEFTGDKCNSCVAGKYGANCSTKCNRGCEGNNCSSSDGTCSCRSNYIGKQCENCTASRYGEDCSNPCSMGCLENTCSPTNGKCDCKDFYTGDKCDVCENGRYGENCSKLCSGGCLDNTCSSIDGKCVCGDFYTGDTCDVCVDGPYSDGCLNASRNERTEADKPNIGAVVGGVVVAVLVIVTAAVVVIIFKRRNKLCCKKPRDEDQQSEEMHTPQPVVFATVQKNRHSSVSTKPMESSRGNQAHQPPSYLTKYHAKTGNKLYEVISNGKDDSGSVQENVKQEAGHRENIQTQHVELVMTDETTEEDSLEIDEDDQKARAIAITFEEKGGIYYNSADKINTQKVEVNNLRQYVIEKTDIDIEEELEKFPYGLTKPYAVSQKQGNIQRNRYKGIYPYDDTRVKLRDCETDYINASFIDGYKKRHAYIAVLGPMSKQLEDFSPFWQMIWQEKVEEIVMLTNLVEDGKDKCEQYWPGLGTSKIYGKVHVLSQSEDEYAEFTRREFTITKGSETRQLHHFHFTRWPDNGVPDDVIGIIEFRQRVLNIPGQFDGPVLVHCSAGVGRTGTYIALDILTKEGEGEGSIHIPGCVINMRHDRANMIQTMNQYEFLHRALVSSLSDISKPIRGTHFRQYINQMGKKGFNRQFQEMQTILEKPPGYEMQTMERNNKIKGRNRPRTDIPGDHKRHCRSLNSPPGAPKCINAVYIDSLKARNRFLVVQSPMKETVIDFLTLLSQENCTCVVRFEPSTEKQKKKNVGLYFPAGDHILKQGIFQVRCTKQENHGYCTERLLTIKHNAPNGQSSEREVTHFEFNAWDYTSDVPKSSKDYLDLIKSVDANLRETFNRGPVLVHCLDGTGKSALFCVVFILIEKMKIDQDVSVVNTIRKVRSRRASAIPNMTQFEFCHECVLSYIKSFDYSQYANFTGRISSESTT